MEGVTTNASGTSWAIQRVFGMAESRTMMWDAASDQEHVLSLLKLGNVGRENIFQQATKLIIRDGVPVEDIILFFSRFGPRVGAPQLHDGNAVWTLPFIALRTIDFWPRNMYFSSDVSVLYQNWASYFLSKGPMDFSHLGNRIMRLLSQLPLLESLKLPITLEDAASLEGVQPMPQLRELSFDEAYIPNTFATLFPNLETFHLGVFYAGESPSGAFPASLTEFRCLKISTTIPDLFEFESPEFQQLIRVLANSANITTLMLGELDTVPVDATNLYYEVDDATTNVNGPQVQNYFKVIEAFVSLPCWHSAIRMSIPAFPWHRLLQFAEYELRTYGKNKLILMPRALRELVAPTRFGIYGVPIPFHIANRLRRTSLQKAAYDTALQDFKTSYVLFYLPQYYLPSNVRIRNVMVLSAESYTRWIGKIRADLKRVHRVVLGAKRDLLEEKFDVSGAVKVCAPWCDLLNSVGRIVETMDDIMTMLLQTIQHPTELQVLQTTIAELRNNMDQQRYLLTLVANDWDDTIHGHENAPAAATYALELSHALIWLLPIVSQLALLPLAMLGDGSEVFVIIDAFYALIANYAVVSRGATSRVVPIFKAAKRLLDPLWVSAFETDTQNRIMLFDQFNVARDNATTAFSTFVAHTAMPIEPMVETPRHLEFVPDATS